MTKAVGIGEVLWDVFPDGTHHLGGAPLNFAYHANGLGGSGFIASRTGDDDLGARIVSELSKSALATHYLQTDPAKPTGTVSVSLSEAGVPSFTIHEDVAWDAIEMTADLAKLAGEADAVCFGTLAQREETSRATIREFLELAAGARRIFDVNLRQGFYSKQILDDSLGLCSVAKMNDAELEIIAGTLDLAPGEEIDRLRELVSRYELEAAALTMGAAGCLIVSRAGAVSGRAPEIRVADSVGSGDAFAAALAIGLAEGMLPEKLVRFCNLAGAYVAAHPGATPAVNRESLEDFGRSLE